MWPAGKLSIGFQPRTSSDIELVIEGGTKLFNGEQEPSQKAQHLTTLSEQVAACMYFTRMGDFAAWCPRHGRMPCYHIGRCLCFNSKFRNDSTCCVYKLEGTPPKPDEPILPILLEPSPKRRKTYPPVPS